MINIADMGGHDTTGSAPPTAPPNAASIVFYDGDCGLCHATVRFALKRDSEAKFRFAPLQGITWASLRSGEPTDVSSGDMRLLDAQGIDLDSPPDSVIMLHQGTLSIRKHAVVHLLRGLDSPWPWLATLLHWVPTPLANLGYRIVAAVRRRLFKPPAGLCPLVPAPLRDRFLD